MIKLRINSKACAGCMTCVLICSAKHYGVSSPRLSDIVITGDGATASFVPSVCIGCDDRSCVKACPTEALSIDKKTGAIIIDHELCIMCEACVVACEHNGIRVREDKDGNPSIGVCDLCDGDPQCAKYCRHGAIIVENIETE